MDSVLDKRLWINWSPRRRFCGRCRNLEFTNTIAIYMLGVHSEVYSEHALSRRRTDPVCSWDFHLVHILLVMAVSTVVSVSRSPRASTQKDGRPNLSRDCISRDLYLLHRTVFTCVACRSFKWEPQMTCHPFKRVLKMTSQACIRMGA